MRAGVYCRCLMQKKLPELQLLGTEAFVHWKGWELEELQVPWEPAEPTLRNQEATPAFFCTVSLTPSTDRVLTWCQLAKETFSEGHLYFHRAFKKDGFRANVLRSQDSNDVSRIC